MTPVPESEFLSVPRPWGGPVPGDRFPVLAIVGSTRFFMEIAEIARRETLAGRVVLRPHVVKSRAMHGAPITDDEREMLDRVRAQEVDMADEVLVANIGGYVGQSTVRHIDRAVMAGKPIRFEEPRLMTDRRCLLCNGTGERRSLLLGEAGEAASVCPRCGGGGAEPERL